MDGESLSTPLLPDGTSDLLSTIHVRDAETRLQEDGEQAAVVEQQTYGSAANPRSTEEESPLLIRGGISKELLSNTPDSEVLSPSQSAIEQRACGSAATGGTTRRAENHRTASSEAGILEGTRMADRPLVHIVAEVERAVGQQEGRTLRDRVEFLCQMLGDGGAITIFEKVTFIAKEVGVSLTCPPNRSTVASGYNNSSFEGLSAPRLREGGGDGGFNHDDELPDSTLMRRVEELTEHVSALETGDRQLLGQFLACCGKCGVTGTFHFARALVVTKLT